MRTFVPDNEDAVCRYLAAKEWTRNHVLPPEKEAILKYEKDTKEAFNAKWEADMKKIMSHKSRPGEYNWEYLKRHQPKKYEKLMKQKQKVVEDKFSKTVVREL